MTSRFTSRKFLFALTTILLATLLIWHHLIGEATWLSVATSALSVYVLGNVGQKGIDVMAKRAGS